MSLQQSAQEHLIELAQMRLSQRGSALPLSRDEIAQTLDQLLTAFPEWRELTSRSDALAQLGTLFSTFVGEASILRGDDSHTPWLEGRREDIDWKFWGRYRKYLVRRQMPQTAINALHRVTDRALELLGDPASDQPFKRRGMVVGDVQSGKTGNYSGLICKAADAGYKVILILTGMNNNLRSQTQIRLDEGFIGKVSIPLTDQATRIVGVGEIDPSAIVDWATNRTENGDFNARVMKQFGLHPGGQPLLFVVKKNGSVLDGVLEWIRSTGNANDPHGPRFSPKVPLLVIDDEADQASIDTREQKFSGSIADRNHVPSAINSKIRKILERFDQASYVGYTATPFANIFIHPDAETGAEFQDLFPRDFIINIPAPENYVGAARIFGTYSGDEDGPGDDGLPSLLTKLSDYAESTARKETRGWMPPMHKSDHLPLYRGQDTAPPSLHAAIRCFVLAIAARRLRGQAHEHNSMLVHVTRFRAVQGRVTRQVQVALDALANEILYGGERALDSLERVWLDEFEPVTRELNLDDCPLVSWDDIRLTLPAAVASIRVREINGTSADVLDYERNRETGLNVIAIGGDKLARGLTLEGLAISYFLRGSTMYDTLMQMGRWFGYRPGYLDLCRLFTTADLIDWYEHIARASDELRREFDRMEALLQRPIDFGLKVRSHPTLTITSRAKMRHGTKLKVSFAGDVSETTVYATDDRAVGANFEAAADLIERLQFSGVGHVADPEQYRRGGKLHRWTGSHLWTGATHQHVLAFLDSFSTHEDASRADARVLAKYIRRQNDLDELTSWNILLVGGDGTELVTIGGVSVKAVIRQPKGGYGKGPVPRVIPKGDRFDIRRLLNPRDEAVDIPATAYAVAMEETLKNPPKKRRADAEAEPSQPSGVYLRARRSPGTGLLLLYPLAREADIKLPDGTLQRHRFLDTPEAPIGIGISFPASSRAQSVTYFVNSVYGAGGDDEGDA